MINKSYTIDDSFFFLRKSIPEEKETIEKNILSLYKECENFISSDECTKNLRNELEESIPDCLTVLRKWMDELENSDHGIVIAGKLRKLSFVYNTHF